jgi:hypothetical protein
MFNEDGLRCKPVPAVQRALNLNHLQHGTVSMRLCHDSKEDGGHDPEPTRSYKANVCGTSDGVMENSKHSTVAIPKSVNIAGDHACC